MRSFKSFTLIILIGIAAVGLTISSARAALIERDLIAGSGDKLITFDDVNLIEWLDVDATLGKSYHEAKFSIFGTEHGFTHATTADIDLLWLTNFIPNINARTLENTPGVEALLSLMGCTGFCGSGNDIQQGWHDYTTPSETQAGKAFIQIFSDGTSQALNLDSVFGKGTRDGELGNYMIRDAAVTAIPLPPAVGLFAAGLVGLAGIVRRRRKA